MWPAPVERSGSQILWPKLGPAVLHVACGIKGQALCVVLRIIATVSLGVVYACGYICRGLRQNCFPLRMILSRGIVRAY